MNKKNAPPRSGMLRTIVAATFILMTSTVWAQTETDTSFRHQMNTIFGPLEKNRVPHGILRDYAMEFVNLEYYNGTATLADSNLVFAGTFWQVYNTLYTGRIHTTATGFARPDTIDNRWFAYRQPGRITLSGLYFSYSRFKDNASPNFITISSNKLYDKYVGGVWQNPYQEEKVFALSPSVSEYHGLTFNVLLPANLWFANTAQSGLAINLNDGLGYRTLTPGTAMAVSYAAAGQKEWIYRLALIGGGYLYSHSRVNILASPAY